MGALLSAPDETIIQILVLVPGKDIQRCRRVCRHLHELVDGTAQLQYLIELSHRGYIEPTRPRRELTYDQKAKLLREHRLRGASPSHTFTLETTPGPEAEENETQTYTSLRDGIYMEGFSPSINPPVRRLNFYQLPSWNRGTKLKKWELQLGVEAAHVDLNYDLNLLCLVEIQNVGLGDAPSAAVFDVHLRTLDSNDVHPGAAVSKLSWRAKTENSNQHNTWSMSSHIVENLLGILFTHRRSMTNYLIVWDWTSGLKLLHLCNIGHAPGSFTIINKRFVVNHRPAALGGADESLGYLDLYRLDGLDERPPPMVTLSLPLLPSYSARRSTPFHASPPSSVAFDFLSDGWYRPGPKVYELGADADHLCLIRFSFRGTTGWLAIPSSTIHKAVMECEASRSPDMTMISWEGWGERTSWVYDVNSILYPSSAALCSGLRTIAGTQADSATVIWDFGPHAVQSSRRLAESGHELVPRVCYPKGAGPAFWTQRDDIASPSPAGNIFFGDGSLANQPFCASKLTRNGDSGLTMMQGEHSTYNPRKPAGRVS